MFYALEKELIYFASELSYKTLPHSDILSMKDLHDLGDTARLLYDFHAITGQWEESKAQNEKNHLDLAKKLKNSGSYDYIVNRM